MHLLFAASGTQEHKIEGGPLKRTTGTVHVHEHEPSGGLRKIPRWRQNESSTVPIAKLYLQRAALPSYNAIFSELAAQAKNEGDAGRGIGGTKNPRRATVATRSRYAMPGSHSVPRSVMPRGSQGLVGEG